MTVIACSQTVGFLRRFSHSASVLVLLGKVSRTPFQVLPSSLWLPIMAKTSERRIHVRLQNINLPDKSIHYAEFSKCIIEYFGSKDLSVSVHAELRDNSLLITNDFGAHNPVMMKHPLFCPMNHLAEGQRGELTPELRSRGVNVGAVVLLESGDGRLLLSRRAAHLFIFPSIWVPPGGHIEENESLSQAGLRELEEETGLRVCAEDLVSPLRVLALWESVYPPRLSYGPPKRHHVVVYLHGRLKSDLTSSVLQDKIKMDPNETDACVWLEKNIVEAIVMATEDSKDAAVATAHLPETIKAVALDGDKRQVEVDLPLAPLLERSGEERDQLGRVSTGTKMALEEWLKLQ